MDIYQPKDINELRKRIELSRATFYVYFIKSSIRDRWVRVNTLQENVYLSNTNKKLRWLNKHVLNIRLHEGSGRTFSALFSSRRIK